MSTRITEQEIRDIAETAWYEYAAVKAVIQVEGSGTGYDDKTGKIKIQFEPHWFRKYDELDGESVGGVWEQNKVETQPGEWVAFNNAFAGDPVAAMLATSWGIMQVMGFNHKAVGFDTVNEMVDFAKASEYNQVLLGVRFIQGNRHLDRAIREHDWKVFAYYYNGPKYAAGKYDIKLHNAYNEALG